MTAAAPPSSAAPSRLPGALGRVLPAGSLLSEAEWGARHKGFVVLLLVQAAGLAAFGLARGYGVAHALLEGGAIAVFALAAQVPTLSRGVRSSIATVGLLSTSAALVHLSGGTIEAHFHFFVMVSLVTLYQSWTPYLLAVVYVVVHHGVVGTLQPELVYNHAPALEDPVTWAFIHGLFIIGASFAGLIVWKRIEELRAEELEEQQRRALEIHDNVVQGLAVASMAMELDRQDTSQRAVVKSLRSAQDIVADLLTSLESGGVRPGDLIRKDPADPLHGTEQVG